MQPLNFNDALELFRNRIPRGEPWNSEQWAAQSAEVRERAFFSATVENIRFLQRAKDLIGAYLEDQRDDVRNLRPLESGGKSDFVRMMREFMVREGMLTADSFDNATSLRDIRSRTRLNLIFDTQTRQAHGYGAYKQGLSPVILDAFPAARFVRVPGAKIKRERHRYHEGDVALKTNVKWWANYQNARELGGFEVPYAPYGFNSYMRQEDVPRREAIKRGLIKRGDRLDVPNVGLNDELRASLQNVDPELIKKLRNRMGRSGVVRQQELVFTTPSETLESFKARLIESENEFNARRKKSDVKRQELRDELARIEQEEEALKKLSGLEYHEKVKKLNEDIRAYNKGILSQKWERDLLALDLVSLPESERSTVKVLKSVRAKNKIDGIDAIQRVVHKDYGVTINFDKQVERAYHEDKGTHGDIAMNSKTSPGVVAHEIMHQIERRHFLSESLAYLKSRTEGESLVRLARLFPRDDYKWDEVAYLDQFQEKGHSAYTGKWYGGRATEMLTMGIERLISDPFKLLKDDEEFFDWIVKLTRKLS